MSNEPNLNKADSEIALTALLSAAVMGYPIPDFTLYPAVKFVAVSLLLLTLVRRIGIMNGLTSHNTMIQTTTYLMDPATYISFFYLSYVFIAWLSGIIGLDSNPSAAALGVGTSILVFFVFIGSEILFGSALSEGERGFSATAQQHRGEVIGAFFSQIAIFVGSRSPNKKIRQTKLSEFYERTVDEYSFDEHVQIGKSFLIMLLSFSIVALSYASLLAVGIYVFPAGGVAIILLLISVVFVSAFFRLWYSNYGLMQIENKNGYITFVGESITFFVITQMVL